MGVPNSWMAYCMENPLLLLAYDGFDPSQSKITHV